LKENDKIRLVLHGFSLENLDTIGKSDPFLVLSNHPEKSEKFVETEVVSDNLNPAFRPIFLKVAALKELAQKKNTPLELLKISVECFDDDPTGAELIGSFHV
jgi:hypothetical protein